MRGGTHAAGVKPHSVVAHLHRHMRGVAVHRHQYLAGLGVLADVGQRLLHHAVHRELRCIGQLHRLQAGLDVDARALGVFARQDLQRGREPQVRQGRRPQVFDDAALERNAAVERLRQVLEPLRHIGCGGVDLGLEARHIELGGCQQRAQFVMQLSRQMAALFFAHLLQVVGQLRQRGGAVPHQALQAVALALQHLLLAQVHRLHGLCLAQVHVKGQQADGGDGGNADARQHQRLLDLLTALLQALVAAGDELLRMLADRLHVFLAHIGVEDELPRVFVALAAQAQAQFHLGQLARYLPRQQRKLLHVCRRAHELHAQAVEIGLHGGHGLVVGLQVGFIAREQIAALTGFCIQHALQQLVHIRPCGKSLGQLLHRILRAHVPHLVDAYQHHGSKQRHGQAQGHLPDLR